MFTVLHGVLTLHLSLIPMLLRGNAYELFCPP